jgi:hypothetical protein
MQARKRRTSSLLAVLLIATPAWAHHSPTAVFIMDAPVSFTATLTAVHWINPHIRLDLDPHDKVAHPKPWVFESQPPQWYRQVNVSRKVFEDAIGQTVEVSARPARNGEPFGFLLSIKFKDGTSFEMVRDLIQGQE